MSSENEANLKHEADSPIQTIKIEVDKRYIVVFDFPGNAPLEEVERITRNARDELYSWQNSNDQFKVIGLWGGIKVRLERVPDEPHD